MLRSAVKGLSLGIAAASLCACTVQLDSASKAKVDAALSSTEAAATRATAAAEKAEKAARLAAKTAAARQAITGAGQPAAAPAPAAALPPLDEAKKALIAAAIARAQAQKQGVQPKNIDNLTPEKQAEIREIEARRAQVREMAKTPPEEPV